MNAQGGRPAHTSRCCRLKEAERGTRKPLHQSSVHHLRTSLSAGPKRSSGGRRKRRRGKSQVSRGPVLSPPLSLPRSTNPPLIARRNEQTCISFFEL